MVLTLVQWVALRDVPGKSSWTSVVLGPTNRGARSPIAGRSCWLDWPMLRGWRVNMYSPQRGPADHHDHPSHTSLLAFMWLMMLVIASSPICVAPEPILLFATATSPRPPRSPCCLAHCVNTLSRVAPMVVSTIPSVVPDESESRYWWTSKA